MDQKKKSKLDTQQNYISTLYIQFHQSKHYLHIKIPIYKNEEKFIHDFIHTQETSCNENGKRNTA